VRVPVVMLLLVAGCGTPASPPPVAADADVAEPEAPPTPEEAKAAIAAAMTAYQGHDYETCADRYDAAGELGASDAYNAACCDALDGRSNDALARLDQAIDAGYSDVDYLTADEDLRALRGDPRWVAVVAKVKGKHDAWLAANNAELLEIYTADQADRAGTVPAATVSANDAKRKARVAEILAADGAKSSEDYFHAAMVYQHGQDVADYEKAHELAVKATTIEPVESHARWLAAASEDRALMTEGKPQKYGTQYQPDATGKWALYPVDPATTDAERAQWDVPTLAEANQRAAAMNAKP
jgi:hypothetical protein